MVASAGTLMANHPWKGRGYKSNEPFKFWWAPTTSLERLIVSCAVNFVSVKLLMVVGQLLITLTVEICIQQLGRVEEMVWLP